MGSGVTAIITTMKFISSRWTVLSHASVSCQEGALVTPHTLERYLTRNLQEVVWQSDRSATTDITKLL